MSDTTQLDIQEDMDSRLPEGWTIAKLGDLCTHPQYGWTTSANKNGTGLKLLRTTDISGGTVNWSTVPACTERPDDPQKYLLAPGDILVSRAGSVGLSYLVKQCPEAIFASYLIRFRPKPPLESEFIDLFLKSPQYWAAIAEEAAGIAIPNVNASKLKEIEVPLPPLSEQKRIVAKLEELLGRINVTKERLVKVSIIVKRFRQVLLAAACSGRLTTDWRSTQKGLESADQLVERIKRTYREQYEAECSKAKREGKRLPKKPEILELRRVETGDLPEIPDEWTWVYLPAVGYMSRGKSKHRPRNAAHLYGGPYPFIQTGDIAQSRGLITSHRQTYSEAGLAQSHLWPAGTICITIAANIAHSAILTYPACFPDSVVGVISDGTLCFKEYVEFFIRTARANLDQFAPATAQKNINIEILRDVAVPLPSLAEQKEIVRRVESMFKLADIVEERVAAALIRAEKLTQAILAKAFRGELVLTEAELARREGRNYESGSMLLERVRADRADTSSTFPDDERSKAKRQRVKAVGLKGRAKRPRTTLSVSRLLGIIRNTFGTKEFRIEDLLPIAGMQYDQLKEQLFSLSTERIGSNDLPLLLMTYSAKLGEYLFQLKGGSQV